MAEKQNTEKQSAFKELVLPVIVLVVICLVCSALLAVLNDITAPIIAENTQAETLAAYVSVLPEGTTTDSMTAIDGLTTANVQGAVKTANGDVAVKAAASGYSGKDVTVYVAFDAEGAISGISIDGSTGNIYGEQVATVAATGNKNFNRFMGWADAARQLLVMTNADNPRDAQQAVDLGAEGLGLCRTEHMFFAEDRIKAVREMICARTVEEREAALAKVEPFQQGDFEAM